MARRVGRYTKHETNESSLLWMIKRIESKINYNDDDNDNNVEYDAAFGLGSNHNIALNKVTNALSVNNYFGHCANQMNRKKELK